MFPLVCLTLLLLSSCKRPIEKDLDDENDRNASFISNKPGSWWVYGVSDGTVNKRVATGEDSLMQERTFDYYELIDTVTGNTVPEYFAKNQEYMLMLIDIDGERKNYGLMVVYKENAQVGDSWMNTGNFTFSGVPIQGKIEGTVESINGTKTIGDHTFTQVSVIHNELKAKLVGSPAYTNCGTARIWFAQGIGVIKSEYDFQIGSFLDREYSDSLLSYHLQP